MILTRTVRNGMAIAGLLAIFQFCFTSRIVPEPLYDRSIYQSVGERLLAGDRLYVDVLDNKDPLFYYAVALQRLLGPLAEYAFELAAVLGSALIAAGLARRLHPDSVAGQSVVLLVTAFMLTGPHYDAGGTIPPGILLCLATIRLALDRRGLGCGLALAALWFAKLIYTPIALAFIAAGVLSGPGGLAGARRFLGSAALSTLAGLGAIALVLAVRGEWQGYLQVQAANIFYSGSNVFTSSGVLGNVRNHVLTAIYFGTPILVLSLAVFVWLVRLTLAEGQGSALRAYRIACVVVYPVTLGIVAVTAIWGAHLAVLHVFLALAGATVIPDLFARCSAWTAGAIVAGAGMVLGWAGADNPPWRSPLDFPGRLQALVAPSPEAEALRRVAGPGPVRYARLGSDNDFHHAAGTHGYRLACPQFFQYRFTAQTALDRLIDCASRADFLIVDFPEDEPLAPGTFVTPVADFATLNRRWARYVARAEAMVALRFRCQPAAETLRICRRLS